VPAPGITPPDAYDFCDYMPVSAAGKTYVRSSRSFSSMYAAFLQLLESDSPALAAAIRTNTMPPFDVNAAIPPGWTRVNYLASGLTIRPAWTIPVYPFDWLGSVVRTGMNMEVANTSTIISAGGSQNSLGPQEVSKFGFSAEAWGAIPITPGPWFDSSFIALARATDGPWKRSGWRAGWPSLLWH
jgi:hypothetical protein